MKAAVIPIQTQTNRRHATSQPQPTDERAGWCASCLEGDRSLVRREEGRGGRTMSSR